MSNAEQLLADLLSQIAAERSLSNPQIEVRPISSGGANYTSQLFLATISDGDTQLQLFAKVAAVGEKFREQAPIEIFDVEKKFYTKLAKMYETIQDKHNIPEDKRFKTPEFYGCNEKLYEETIVLENLSAKGYQVYNRLKSVDWAYASSALEELAKFHALSVALMKDNEKEYDTLLDEFENKFNPETAQLIKDVLYKSMSAIKEEYKPKMTALFDTFDAAYFHELCKPLKLTVFAHNDYRVSNQMYKADADGRIHMRIVDYQTIRAAPPVLDLLYFIFTSTDQQFRAQHYDRLLGHYYCELRRALQRFGVHADDVYTREDFDLEYKAKLPFGLTVAVFALPVITVDAEHAPTVDKDMDMSKLAVHNFSALFPERINGIIDDFIRWGVL